MSVHTPRRKSPLHLGLRLPLAPSIFCEQPLEVSLLSSIGYTTGEADWLGCRPRYISWRPILRLVHHKLSSSAVPTITQVTLDSYAPDLAAICFGYLPHTEYGYRSTLEAPLGSQNSRLNIYTRSQLPSAPSERLGGGPVRLSPILSSETRIGACREQRQGITSISHKWLVCT